MSTFEADGLVQWTGDQKVVLGGARTFNRELVAQRRCMLQGDADGRAWLLVFKVSLPRRAGYDYYEACLHRRRTPLIAETLGLAVR